MKKLILILAILFTTLSFAQKSRVDVLIYKQLTTTERNAFTVPAGENWTIYNTTTNQLEFWDGAAWQAVAGGGVAGGTKAEFDTALTDDNFAFLNQANIFTQNQSITGNLKVSTNLFSGTTTEGVLSFLTREQHFASETAGQLGGLILTGNITGINQPVYSIYARNLASIAADKRIAQIDFDRIDDDDAGEMRFVTANATGTLLEALKLTDNQDAEFSGNVNATGTVIGSNLSGTNTGNQTSIVDILGTKTQFNTSLSDGNFIFVGDAPTLHTHTFAGLTSKPTTISGFGITDAFTKTESDAKYLLNTTDTLTGDFTATGTIISSGTGNSSFVGDVAIGSTNANGKLRVHQNAIDGTVTHFQMPHLKLTGSTIADNSGFVGMTFATSGTDNFGYSLGAQRTTAGLGDFRIDFHNNSSLGVNRFIIDQNGDATFSSDVTANSFNGVFRKKVTLSSAQILALNTTPIEIVAAPGVGKVISVRSMVTSLNFNTIAYATNSIFGLVYSGENTLVTQSQLLFSTVDKITTSITVGNLEMFSNTAVDAKSLSSNPTLGNSTVDVYITYEIITL